MESVHSRCAGLDVHKKSVTACIRIQQGNQTVTETRLFGTFTRDLERLRDWLMEAQVKEIAMESTGVFWIPVWNVLERATGAEFQLTLINPQHARALPGRKSDRLDCERIAELHQYGLLQASFIPPAPVRELRDLTRRRAHLQQERNRLVNRIARLLETVNIKLGSVVSDLTGKTSQLILAAVAKGSCDPQELVKLAQASLKNKKDLLLASLEGFSSEHFQWLLSEALKDLKLLDTRLEQLDRRIGKALQPHADLILRLCTIPGFDFTAAATVLAEVGFDMKRFADPGHLASWAGLCPGCHESAGKRASSRTRKGSRYLRRLLTQCAWSILRKKNCFLTALFFRIAARGGRKKAAMAVAHRMLTIVWHIIAEGGVYKEIGACPPDNRSRTRAARRLARRLAELGFPVDLKPRPEPESVGPTPDKPSKQPKPKFQKLLVRRKPRSPKPATPMDAPHAQSAT
jgi:transposase